jgi:TolB-like protein
MRKQTAFVMAALAAAGIGAGAARAADGAAARAGTAKVLVIPFAALNVPESQQWIPKGVQENLVADLGRTNVYAPVAFRGEVVVEDNATAARLAKQASAALAVRGAAQVVGEQVRLTAQLIDAKTGETVSTASVTGVPGELLKLEDELSAQLRGVSNRQGPAVAAGVEGATPAGGAAVPAAAQPPVIVINQPPAAPAYPAYPAYAASYGYTSPLFTSGLYYPGVFSYVVNTGSYGHHGGFGHGRGGVCFPNTGVPGTTVRLIRSQGPAGGPLTMTTPAGGIVPTSAASFGPVRVTLPTPQATPVSNNRISFPR